MIRVTFNLENCTKEEKQRATDIAICYAITPVDKAINTITIVVEDPKISHLISSLPSSVIIIEQQKIEDNTIIPQIQYYTPTGWLIVSKDHYSDLNTQIAKLKSIEEECKKLKATYKDLMGSLAGLIDKFPYDV